MAFRQNEAESGWLRYARCVISNPSHVLSCIREGGAQPSQPAPFDMLRWPGYLGESYARILCLGMIHNGDMLFAGRTKERPPKEARNSTDASVIDLEPVALAWKEGRISDGEYLTQARRTYLRALPHWDPWKRFKPIVKGFGFEPSPAQYIAYSNIAKCWSDTSDKKRDDYRVMSCCSNWSEANAVALVKAIAPLAILVATWNAGAFLGQLPDLEDGRPPDVWGFHYLRGTLRSETSSGEDLRRDVWVRTAAERYVARRKITG